MSARVPSSPLFLLSACSAKRSKCWCLAALPLGWLRRFAIDALNCAHCCGSHLSARKPLPFFLIARKRWFVSDACRYIALLLLAALELLQAAVAGHPQWGVQLLWTRF